MAEVSEALMKKPMLLGRGGFEFDFESAQRFAQALISGEMVPKGIKSTGAVLGIMQAGKELGLPPMYALSNLTFTNGRLGIMGDAAKALIRATGVLKPGTDFTESYNGKEYTPEWTCTVTAHRDGQPAPFVSTFSIADAIAAKLIRLTADGKVQTYKRDGGWADHSAPWTTYTKRLMKYRALGFLVRDHFSDVIGGLVTTEELRDYPIEVSGVSAAPPAEPDPLLTAAPVFEAPVVEEEVVESAIVESDQQPIDGPVVMDLDSAITKLETDIAIVPTREGLDKVWADASSVIAAATPKQRKKLSALYDQAVCGFTGEAE